MMVAGHAIAPSGNQALDFTDWRARLDRERIPPVVAFAGSRGKTSVLRAVEAIFRTAGYRFASWTDRGVEIEGERQRGELGPWSRVLTRLTSGGLDIALRELDWVTLQAVASHETAYPVVAISTLCANNEACLVTPETLLARRALSRIRTRLAAGGRLVLNADDLAVLGSGRYQRRCPRARQAPESRRRRMLGPGRVDRHPGAWCRYSRRAPAGAPVDP